MKSFFAPLFLVFLMSLKPVHLSVAYWTAGSLKSKSMFLLLANCLISKAVDLRVPLSFTGNDPKPDSLLDLLTCLAKFSNISENSLGFRIDLASAIVTVALVSNPFDLRYLSIRGISASLPLIISK